MCNETIPCHGGVCQGGACNCFPLWTGELCDSNVLATDDAMYKFFWGYLWSILIIFALITIAAILQLSLLIVDSVKTGRRINNVKITLFALIAVIGISKCRCIVFEIRNLNLTKNIPGVKVFTVISCNNIIPLPF